jgi:hypothetical protein
VTQRLFVDSRKTVEVTCTVDIAQTPTELYAHVALDGIEVQPGDTVLVQGGPLLARHGERLVCDRLATVTRAGRLERFWTRVRGCFDLAELFEVGFSQDRHMQTTDRFSETVVRRHP